MLPLRFGQAGLDHQIPQRRLVLLRDTRNNPWPDTPRAKEIRDAFVAAGGILHDIAEADLKVFAALTDMSADPDPSYPEWLAEHKPASHTALFQAVLPDQPARSDPGAAMTALDDAKRKGDKSATPAAHDAPSIPLGSTVDSREPFALTQVARASPMPATRVRAGAWAITVVSMRTSAGLRRTSW